MGVSLAICEGREPPPGLGGRWRKLGAGRV